MGDKKINSKSRVLGLIGLMLIVAIMFTVNAEACRFWVSLSKNIPEKFVLKQLLVAPDSLKYLGKDYDDGWSVGYYEHGYPVIFRGAISSLKDKLYDRAVMDVSEMRPSLVFGHIRKASSGCVDGVKNPHPFDRIKNGKTWIFGHHGGIDKALLIKLIGREYLGSNLPQVCSDNPPDSWVDSELYFIYLLKYIEQNHFDVNLGLRKALQELYKHIEDKDRYLNFFLSNGDDLWIFRKGNDLYYAFDEEIKLAAVTSTIPQKEQVYWKEVPENMIGYFQPEKKPEFLSLAIEDSYLITGQECSLSIQCPQGYGCYEFPHATPRCAKEDPCTYFDCPDHYRCLVQERIPEKVECLKENF